jgi:hypothetical protein
MPDHDIGGAPAPFSNGPETAERGADGRFINGGRGGPGRPRGARHAALAALDAIGSKAAEEVLGVVVAAAKGGDLRAAEVLLRRLWPERKGRPIEFELPPVVAAADVVTALTAVTTATARGELTPEEALALSHVLEAQRKAIETADLAQRIAALEASAPPPRGADR